MLSEYSDKNRQDKQCKHCLATRSDSYSLVQNFDFKIALSTTLVPKVLRDLNASEICYLILSGTTIKRIDFFKSKPHLRKALDVRKAVIDHTS